MSRIFALIILLFSLTGTAETVTIIYAFGPADTMANYSRTLVDEANRIQQKYTFLFDTRPGAGSSIAARYVENNTNTILQTSSAHFIRPNFYPTESHEINNFRELLPLASPPMAVASAKYRNWSEVPTSRPINVGISGLGTTSHLIAMQIKTRYPNLQPIPFKSTNDSILSLIGGQIDLHVGFLGEMKEWTKTKKNLYILGMTGTKSVGGHPLLINQHFPSILANMDNPQHLVVPKTIPDLKFNEWRNILFVASKASTVQDSYKIDLATPMDGMSTADLQAWYLAQTQQWKKLSSTVKLDK